MKRTVLIGALLVPLLFSACATPRKDYSAFQRARPASILVLPPLNESPDVKATPAVWASATRPLAEAGYYVVPVTLADETFKQNGVTTSHDAQQIPA
ncbi:MAG TPA: GNA1162 family protein, partial [Burkholderiaceae bacterium]|nr:GNA1162 family protein [Burkholderiaceae bacterium]